MPLHPEIAKFVATLPPNDGSVPDPAAIRAGEHAHLPPVAERVQVHQVDDRVIATPAGDIPVRLYTPVEANSYGVIVYFHGGAFFSGSLETHDGFARALAKESGCLVLSVGYQLAPEAEFPTALDECYAAVRWVAEHGDELQWDGATLAVAGDSSGANFATVVAGMAADDGFDGITHQLLFYPSVDLDFDEDRYDSLRENARGYGLETTGLKPWNSFYIEGGADPADPRVSPIKRANLAELPAALVITAEFDPLRDEGEAYAVRLQEQGVPVEVHRFAGMGHGFMQHFAWLPEGYAAFERVGEFLAARRP